MKGLLLVTHFFASVAVAESLFNSSNATDDVLQQSDSYLPVWLLELLSIWPDTEEENSIEIPDRTAQQNETKPNCGRDFVSVQNNSSYRFQSTNYPRDLSPYEIRFCANHHTVFQTEPGYLIELNVSEIRSIIQSNNETISTTFPLRRLLFKRKSHTIAFDMQVSAVPIPSEGVDYYGRFKNLSGELGQDNCSCGETEFSGFNGTINSPNYPNYYCNFLRCLYTITVPESMAIKMDFEGEIEECCDVIMVFDTYAIYDVPSFLQGVLDGRTVYINGSTIQLQFFTDDMIVEKGFQMQFSAVSREKLPEMHWKVTKTDCPCPKLQNLFIQLLPAPCALNCSYSLSTKENFVLKSFLNGSLTDDQEVSIDGRKKLDVNHEESVFYSQSNKLQITISTRGASSNSFNITFQPFKAACLCPPVNYSNLSGQIQSPNYPNPYCPNLNCTYRIHISPGYGIHLKFDGETEKRCDFVTLIYNGKETRLHGDLKGKEMIAKSNLVTVVFVSDDSIGYSGFSISYRAVHVVGLPSL